MSLGGEPRRQSPLSEMRPDIVILLLTESLLLACLVGTASSATLRLALGGPPDEVLVEVPPSGRWRLSWREVSFNAWFDSRNSTASNSTNSISTNSSSNSTTTKAPAATMPCFPPGPDCADKILVTPDIAGKNCAVGYKRDNRGRCRPELGANNNNNDKKKKKKNPKGKKKVVKGKKKVKKTKQRKVRKTADKQKAKAATTQ